MPLDPLVLPGQGVPEVPEVGVAIAPTKDGAHVGICFRDAEGQQRLMHLAGHCDLRNEPLSGALQRFAVGPAGIPTPRAEAVSVFLGYIWERCGRRGITYGLKYKGPTFGADGRLRLPEGTIGLTCSTFVVSALASMMVEFIQYETWPLREADAAAQGAIISTWEAERTERKQRVESLRTKAAKVSRSRQEEAADGAVFRQVDESIEDLGQRLDAMRGEVAAKAVRYRPEEIAAAMLMEFASWPVAFIQVEVPAQRLMSRVAAGCPVLGARSAVEAGQ